MPDSNQSIDQLKKRFEELSLQKVKYETQRDAAASELSDLKQQALELYGSDDVKQLEKMLAEMKTENEAKRSEYQASLDKIDANLRSVQESFEAAQSQENEV